MTETELKESGIKRYLVTAYFNLIRNHYEK